MFILLLEGLKVNKMFYNMTLETLFASISHLYRAMDIIVSVNNDIVDDVFTDCNALIKNMSNGWLEVNTCRVYTQHIVDMEDLLIPSMGLINDAKCMLESLLAWKIGITPYGKHNIVKCLREAGLDYINPALEELEFWFDQEKKNNELDADSLITCVTF
jgi:hypothetical protein